MSESMVVVNVYQCPAMDGKFQKDGKKLLRKAAKMPLAYVNEKNENWQSGGRIYEIDQEATKVWREEWQMQQEIRKEEKAVKDEIKNNVLGAIGNIVSETKGRKKGKTKID
jgi:hypothetical protein